MSRSFALELPAWTCQARGTSKDALIGYFDELEYAREMLDRRYDDLESGKGKLISGDEVRARLRAKSDSRRAGRS